MAVQVLIRVNKVIDYQPLKRKTSKSVQREEQIKNLSELTGLTEDQIVLRFGYYLSQIVKLRIKDSVAKQKVGNKRFSTVYKPLSEEYKKRKRYNTRDKFWINTGRLINSIEVWRWKNRIFVGIKDKEVHKLILFLEKGTKNGVPARPLVFPIIKNISSRIDAYFNQYVVLEQNGKLKY